MKRSIKAVQSTFFNVLRVNVSKSGNLVIQVLHGFSLKKKLG